VHVRLQMRRDIRSWFVAIGAAVLLVSVALADESKGLRRAQPGVWLASGQYLWPGPTAIADFPLHGRDIIASSPDGAITTRVTETELTLVDRNNAMRFAGASIPLASLGEILWAPDSTAFALTQSDGGWVGTWSVKIYRLKSGGVSASDPGGLPLADFKRLFPRCSDEYANVAAVGWLDGSRRLRLVVEMPCHSSCSDMCKVVGYVVDPTHGGVIERVPAPAIRGRWKTALGLRLRSE